MNVKISAHALQRMNERGISEAEVLAIFESEAWEEVSESKIDQAVLIAQKSLRGKKWAFVFNRETGTLITCYPRR